MKSAIDDELQLYAHLNVAENTSLDVKLRQHAYEVLIQRIERKIKFLAEGETNDQNL